ncbi:hypothetical protein AB9P05_19355 [Roseivirga sp. BDSF3-8]|uniref:hypothetical protein n=1 Tax=Roseivirga sp. BDSF3-8 TaxID=3241598 RepID=UPI003531D515
MASSLHQQQNSQSTARQASRIPVQPKANQTGRLSTQQTAPAASGTSAPVQMQAPATTGPTASGAFTLGPPQRPNITHDEGFLAAYDEATGTGDPKFEERDPEWSDHLKLLKWRTKLEGAEALRPDLADGTAAYRHFLDGGGADRYINYERYLLNDASGQTTLTNVIAYTKRHAQRLCPDNGSVQITSGAFTVGQSSHFSMPYPETENWQKAIGGHNIWISAQVSCTTSGSNKSYNMNLTIHMEDRYNFNPGQSDIATGIPDSDNGIFEVTGLANQYMNYGTVHRTVSWSGSAPAPTVTDDDDSRNRRPSDNRRLRNRI